MKLYAPKYYHDFRCKAGDCRHSCCIGWEIDVDAVTLEKYAAAASSEDYSAKLLQSVEQGETPHFRLAEGDRCPHLNDAGLCRIMLELSEDYLCDICREHPRFYNDTPHGREVGLGMACEAVCELVLCSPDYAETVEVGEVEGEPEPADFDAIACRAQVYAVLSDRSLPYAERLERIGALYDCSPALLTDGQWHEVLDSLEYLDERHRGLFMHYTSAPAVPPQLEQPLERALAYFIFRHCSGAYNEEEFAAALGLSLFCERLTASAAAALGADGIEGLAVAAQAVSEEIEYSEENTDAIKFEF